MKKNSKKVKGEVSKYKAEKSSDKLLVSYWNLIRSYILFHYPDKIVCFYADGISESRDFLHYANINVFETEEDMNEFSSSLEKEDAIIIRSINGKIKD